MDFLNMLDLFGAICGFVSSGLSSNNDIRHWPISMMSFLLYGIIFAYIGMLGNSLVQFLLLSISLLGWQNWSDCESSIRWASKRELFSAMLMGICGIFLILIIQHLFAVVNLVDACSATFLFLGIYALGQKYIQVWCLFFFLDLYFCTTMIQTGLYFSATKYLVYLFFAQFGYFNWYTLSNQN